MATLIAPKCFRALHDAIMQRAVGQRLSEYSMEVRVILKVVASLITSFVGIAGSIYLKALGIISEPSLVLLILASTLVGLFLSYSDKVKSVNLKKGELILKEMKDTESSVKELGRAVLEVTEASSHSLMLESFDPDAYEQAVSHLRDLVA
ncbi:hypothetical protein KHP57_16635 [Algiphilus sp. NNCM1]|nr:hypothetical protein [Algiphilus acroporae]